MIHEKLQQSINDQINAEFYSAYLYLSMAAHFEESNLSGFANWMKMQAQEEQFHAMKFFHYLTERGGKVELQAIEKPKKDWDSVIEIFSDALEHERYVTRRISDMMDLSIEEKDHATVSFLKWYVDEQVEEEASAEEILGQLEMIKGQGNALLMLDRELGRRTFTAPPSEE